jgi:hypothetical protein
LQAIKIAIIKMAFAHLLFIQLLMQLTGEALAVVTLDSAAALARGRDLRPAVSAGDAATLWAAFDDRMRTAMKDSLSFRRMLAGIHADAGAIDSVLSEEVRRDGPVFLYRASCRFARAPAALELRIALASDGKVTGLAVRPGEKRAYPSSFLDYRTRTPLFLPFNGEWFVFWGGRTLEDNHHASIRSQRFALDLAIVKNGSTHSGDGRRCEDYWCYGAPVLAPAAGTVVWLADGHPDQAPGGADPSQPIGNGVIIDHGNREFSLLAHLQPRSLVVAMGDTVQSGQLIGRCGNSGNTSEPHLHYHLQNGPDFQDSDGLPAVFVDLLVDSTRVKQAEIRRGQKVERAAESGR